MIDYQKSKIYKIVCNNTGKQYIGSTSRKFLSYRLQDHKRDFERGTKITSKEIIAGGNYDIILIENYPCNSKDELHKRERHFIETLECVNKCVPTRTKKETDKIWRENNKEKIKLNNSKIDSKKHFSRHQKSKRHLDFINH